MFRHLPPGWKFVHTSSMTVSLSDIVFAVPDLHGAAGKVRAVISILEAIDARRVVFLGDLIDKGPDSKGTVDAVLAARDRNPHWTVLRGNHDQMFVDAFKAGLVTGIPATFYDQLQQDERKRYAQLFAELPCYIEMNHVIAVHGGVSWSHGTTDIKEVPEHELLWSYDVRWVGKKLVRGHQPTPRPEEYHSHISLETGGWRDGVPFVVGVVADVPGPKNLVGWFEYRTSTPR